MVEAGLGVAIVDELTISSGHYSKLIVRPFRPRIAITVSAIYAKDKTPSRLTRRRRKSVPLAGGQKRARKGASAPNERRGSTY
jgi:hypothetical protein